MSRRNPLHPHGEVRLRQTVRPVTLEPMGETLTAQGGLALLAEYTHALGR